jgi:copper chaperone CopZ
MKKLSGILLIAGIIFLMISCSSGTKTGLTEVSFKVSGKCGMCKDRIESTAKTVAGVEMANWDQATMNLKIGYKGEINIDDVKKKIANVGHDIEGLAAPDSVYAALPDCCKYR